MTVSATESSQTFACNGSTTVFTCPFRVLEASAMRGYLITIATGARTALTNGTDFEVSDVGEANAIVTTATAYSASYQVLFQRITARVQETDYRDNDPFPAESHEEALDRLTFIAQEDAEALGRTLRVPDGETIDEMPSAVARASRLLGFDSSGDLAVVAPTSGDAADLALDLASDSDAGEGAGMIGYSDTLSYAAGTVGVKLREQVSVWDYMTTAQIADVRARTALLDVTAAVQAAINAIDTATVGSWELLVPDGTYLISGSGARILEIQQGLKIVGQSLEATRFKVAAGSTATCVLEDDGSASKVELVNLTIDVNSNASAECGLRLGQRTTQLGTYGQIDNVMVRGGVHASFVAYDLNINVVAIGKLYTLNCVGTGLYADAAGSGMLVQSFTPLGFTDYGVRLQAGDRVDNAEFEAPGSDDAVPIYFERGGSVGAAIISIQESRVLKTLVEVDGTYFEKYALGPTKMIRKSSTQGTGTSRWGDSASPATTMTATAVGTRSVTDSSKVFRVDQFKGGGLFVTSGAYSGDWYEIESNDVATIYIKGSTWASGRVPLVGATFAVDYAIKNLAGGGYPHGDSGSAYESVCFNLHCANEGRINALTAGLTGTPGAAPTIASASTIAPTRPITFVSGTTAIVNITVPSLFAIGGGTARLIPTGLWTMTAAGNIALAVTAVVNKALDMTYDAGTGKWYPSYIA